MIKKKLINFQGDFCVLMVYYEIAIMDKLLRHGPKSN